MHEPPVRPPGGHPSPVAKPLVRTNYVLVDFENVRPESLSRLADGDFRVLVFVGAGQTKLPFDIAASLQPLGPRAEYVKISGHGPNALDFHIAYYVGRLAASDPAAHFHVVSKDTGFDPLIEHLRSRKVRVGRVAAVSEIPLVKAAAAKSSPERLELALADLRRRKAARPGTVKTLRSTIASLFQKRLSEDEVAVVVRDLASAGHIAVAGTKVTYALPGDG